MRLTIFEKDEDYAAFERVLGDLAASRQTSQAAGKIILTPFLFPRQTSQAAEKIILTPFLFLLILVLVIGLVGCATPNNKVLYKSWNLSKTIFNIYLFAITGYPLTSLHGMCFGHT